MRLRMGITAITAAVLAGCSSGTGARIETPDPSYSPPAVVASIDVTVDTVSSGCDEVKNGKGDCWLPLYETPRFTDTPLNMGGACTGNRQAACWPQPGNSLKVTCQVTAKGRIWLGVTLPADKVVASPASQDRRAYALAQYLRIEQSHDATELPKCDLGG